MYIYEDNVYLDQGNKLKKDEANFKFGIIVRNIDLQLLLGSVLVCFCVCVFLGKGGLL